MDRYNRTPGIAWRNKSPFRNWSMRGFCSETTVNNSGFDSRCGCLRLRSCRSIIRSDLQIPFIFTKALCLALMVSAHSTDIQAPQNFRWLLYFVNCPAWDAGYLSSLCWVDWQSTLAASVSVGYYPTISLFSAHRDSDEIPAPCCLLLGAIPPSKNQCNRTRFRIRLQNYGNYRILSRSM